MPKMIEDCFNDGVVGQARHQGLIEINCINPRQFTDDVHKTIDDRPFGGGDGMIMLAEPLKQAIEHIQDSGPVVYLSPQGRRLDDKKTRILANLPTITLISGRYGGIDQRFIEKYVDEEISIGDYVLSGGELAAAVMIDSISRHIPGVLGSSASSQEDSLSDGFLEQPNFTRPRIWDKQSVPAVLFSGHHGKVQDWKINVGKLVTLKKRPDLFWTYICLKEIPKLREFYSKLTDQDKKILGLKDLKFDKEVC